MFITKIKVPSEWTKVEALVQETVSDFDFSSGTYQLQAEAGSPAIPVRLCVLDQVPAKPNDGEIILGNQVAVYIQDAGDLYCKTVNSSHPIYLTVSQIGE